MKTDKQQPTQTKEHEYLNEEDIQNFMENEKEAATEGNLMNTDSMTKPQLGMQFKTKEEGTNARSEGTNALFKRGVGVKFSVTSFLKEYGRIVEIIHDREQECDRSSKRFSKC